MAKSLITNGYRIICVNGKWKGEHRVVWEAEYGPIPKGCHIHHKDGDKLNNSIENLECVRPKRHSRIHHGYTLKDGKWVMYNDKTGSYVPITAWQKELQRRRQENNGERIKEFVKQKVRYKEELRLELMKEYYTKMRLLKSQSE